MWGLQSQWFFFHIIWMENWKHPHFGNHYLWQILAYHLNVSHNTIDSDIYFWKSYLKNIILKVLYYLVLSCFNPRVLLPVSLLMVISKSHSNCYKKITFLIFAPWVFVSSMTQFSGFLAGFNWNFAATTTLGYKKIQTDFFSKKGVRKMPLKNILYLKIRKI